MSGICGVWRKDTPARLSSTLATVSHGLALRQDDRLLRESDTAAGVAASAAFATQQVFQNERLLLACDADLYDDDKGSIQTVARLARMYEESGPAFVEKLRGAFSIVLWDRRERKMMAAVDGFGINRLVYFENAEMLVVASRLDALSSVPGVSTEINPRAIANFLNFGVNLAPETIFRNVSRLAPGTLLVASERSTRVEKYWDM